MSGTTVIRQSFDHGPWFYVCRLCDDDFGHIWQYADDAQAEADEHEAHCPAAPTQTQEDER